MFSSLEKKSKKEQKRINNQQRQNWGEINPITRRIESKKKYNRKKRVNFDEEITT